MNDATQIPADILREIHAHAEREYPAECCGLVSGPLDAPGALSRVHPCRNAQDDFHRRDPEAFPRTARNAYFLDPGDLAAAHRQIREAGEVLRAIYHSHPDADACFSEEDTRRALWDGEPLHPGVEYLVVSVRGGQAVSHRCFRWNDRSRTFE